MCISLIIFKFADILVFVNSKAIQFSDEHDK